MFTVTPRNDSIEALELRDTTTNSMAVLAPPRGGMLTRLAFAGRHVFFLDESTLRDHQKNVRGGNPVLFPSPGKLEGDAWKRGDHAGHLKQHGFARTSPWALTKTSDKDEAAATLKLVANDDTMKDYPWTFACEYTYALKGNKLRIDQHFENRGKHGAPMPFGAGFHPYFHVKQSDKAAARIGTQATHAFDNVTKKNVSLADGPGTAKIDLTQAEVDLHLLDHGAKPCTLTAGGRTITLRASPEFSHWVIWTLSGKDFVCVEPWTAPGNALNTGERLIMLAPGEAKSVFVEIEATDAAT
jgi:galactose mutarotase-like enzyme